MKKWIIITIIAVCGAIMLLGLRLFYHSEISGDTPPIPTVSVSDERALQVNLGSYTWKAAVDTFTDYNQFLSNLTTVAPGTELQIAFSNKPKPKSIEVTIAQKAQGDLWIENGLLIAIKGGSGAIEVPYEKGTYVYRLSAAWEFGTAASYYFSVEVK
ncbi:hypothetical protein M3223_21735 [Paenibacillus pasadenensis]|uniref:hypothetical protein n=1 Tax=Paenibacillus pasadenensis TaxID=217090 RepID=UPI00203FA75F|nr:hypothetical protein [Paenibacillus pasadenensis]MCM3749961.1 hypothetical protein [Paenibacillus pasadenensis]